MTKEVLPTPPESSPTYGSYRMPNSWLYSLVGVVVRHSLNIKVYGGENIPDDGAIIAPNHTSQLDIPVVGSSLGSLGIFGTFLAKEELFKSRFSPARLCGTIPINRESPGRDSVRAVRNVLASDEHPFLVSFLEGTRNPGLPTEIKDGGYSFSRNSKKPIVPTGVVYPDDFGLTQIRKPIVVHFGEPLPIPTRGGVGKEEFSALVLAAMQESYYTAQSLSIGSGKD